MHSAVLEPFATLRERLLKGGIAPRHVRRYLGELEDHLVELTRCEEDAGYDPAEAAIRARALLGPDDELADAMLKQRDFRSLSARFPWLVFGIVPPLALILGFLLLLVAMMLVGVTSGAVIPDHKSPLPLPAWFDWTATGLMFTGSFLVPALLGTLLAWMAQRQRMRLFWPLLGMAVILLLNLHGAFHTDNGRIGLYFGTMLPFFPIKGPLGPMGTFHWPTLLGQAALLCLPAIWLLRKRRKTGA